MLHSKKANPTSEQIQLDFQDCQGALKMEELDCDK